MVSLQVVLGALGSDVSGVPMDLNGRNRNEVTSRQNQTLLVSSPGLPQFIKTLNKDLKDLMVESNPIRYFPHVFSPRQYIGILCGSNFGFWSHDRVRAHEINANPTRVFLSSLKHSPPSSW